MNIDLAYSNKFLPLFGLYLYSIYTEAEAFESFYGQFQLRN